MHDPTSPIWEDAVERCYLCSGALPVKPKFVGSKPSDIWLKHPVCDPCHDKIMERANDPDGW